MRRATLLHKQSDKASGDVPRVVELLHERGYSNVTTPMFSKSNAHQLVEDPGDLVVAIGGDGTIGAIAFALARRGVPLLILPRGTMNNVARSFGVPEDLDAWGEWLDEAAPTPVDLGRVDGAQGSHYFFEAAGVGLMHSFLSQDASDEDKAPPRVHELLLDLLKTYEPQRRHIEIDESPLVSEDLMVEAVNIRYTGPGLSLAPSARSTDHLLRIVLVKPERRAELAEALQALVAGREPRWPDLDVRCAQSLELTLPHERLRIDDHEWPRVLGDEGAAGHVRISVEPHAVTLMLSPSRLSHAA